MYNGNSNINLWRGTLYLAGWNYFLNNRLRFYYDAFWQTAFSNNNNYRTQFDIGVDLPVWKGLGVNLLYTFQRENIVAQNIKQADKILTLGLLYNFKNQYTGIENKKYFFNKVAYQSKRIGV